MPGVLYPQPASLHKKLIFLGTKRIVGIIVWLAFKCYRGSAKRSIELHDELQYVGNLFRPFLPEEARIAIFDDLVEGYRKICDEEGEQSANRWLFEETTESLVRLILRRALLFHLLANFKRLFRRKLFQAGPVEINYRAGQPPTLAMLLRGWGSAGAVLLFGLLVSVTVLSPGTRSVDQIAEAPANKPLVPQEIPSPSPTPIPTRDFSETQGRPPRPKPNRIGEVDEDHSRKEPLVALTLKPYEPGVRGDEFEVQVCNKAESPNTRILISLPLPGHSKPGLYVVGLETYDGARLRTWKATQSDGRVIQKIIDLRRIHPGVYIFSVLYRGDEGPPTLYYLRITE